MDRIEIKEAVGKPLRPDARREVTDSAYRAITNAEFLARNEKTRKLRQARLAAARIGQQRR